MKLILAQPDQTLFERPVYSVTLETGDGLMGVLPRHTDLVTSLVPGILTIRTSEKGEKILFAVDTGMAVKQGDVLRLMTRRAVQGRNLATLRETVEDTYKQLDEKEAKSRGALRLLEADFYRQFAEMETPDERTGE